MSKRAVLKLTEAATTAKQSLDSYMKEVDRLSALLEKAKGSVALCEKAIGEYEKDIAAIEYGERLARLYGKDPRQ